ncbi:hypothetical protein FQA39_LY03737 [Lamprigera yunnana]|nr:hypothetical protein FQA39_LY03737 [Lamprigera yunnana]
MKCCSIKLANRSEEKAIFQKDQPRCHPVLLENDTGCRFSFNGDRLEKRSPGEKTGLSVLNIILPKDAKAFNTGSSIQRWANKRPRLKSSRKSEPQETQEDFDNLDVTNLIEELEQDLIREELETEKEQEIDPDIQKLLEETHVEDDKNFKNSIDDDGSKKKEDKVRKRKHKKKSKEKHKHNEKKKVKKTVSFSVSKPPTPQTQQVIRVDVISNYSIEFDVVESGRTDNLSTCERTPRCEAEKTIDQFLYEDFKEEKRECETLVLESKKAVLFRRCGK